MAAADQQHTTTTPLPTVTSLAAEWWRLHRALPDAQTDEECSAAIERLDGAFCAMQAAPPCNAAEAIDKLRVVWRDSDFGRHIDSRFYDRYASTVLADAISELIAFAGPTLAGIDTDPEAERRRGLREIAGADDDRGVAASRLVAHVGDRSDAFLLRILRDRDVADVPTAELAKLADEFVGASEAEAAELERFVEWGAAAERHCLAPAA